MLYYEYLAYPFIAATVVAVGWITWKAADWKISLPNTKDSRWKNHSKIVDFVFASTTIYATIIVAIVGYVN